MSMRPTIGAASSLIAILLAAPAAAQQLGFERWGAANVSPADWQFQAGGHEATTQCAPDCVLQVRHSAAYKPGDSAFVGREIALGAAAGHKLTFSGSVRTDQLNNGFGTLWLRVKGERGRSLAFAYSPPSSGTSPWTSFSVSALVPGNATQVVLGMQVMGQGTAWFDHMRLDVDTTVSVPDAVLPARPVKPVRSQALLDDAALKIAAADMPEVPPAWAADIRARRKPLRSLFSDDFSDLQFLKPLLAGKRLVQLGESSHGVSEFYLAKVRLIKFLHEQMGYDVIAFESPMSMCYQADQSIGTASPTDVMRHCVFGNFQNAEIAPLFDYLALTRKSDRPLVLAGFDIQDVAGPTEMAPLRAMLAALKSPLAAELDMHEQTLGKYPAEPLAGESAARMAAFYGAAAEAISANRAQLAAAGKAAAQIDIAAQSARARAVQVRNHGRPMSAASNALRDTGMADNLNFLLDTLYPKSKVVVWGHNVHIAYQGAPDAWKSMGAHIAERRKAQTYTVGLYMGRGEAALNDGKVYDIDAPAPATMEAVLANGGTKYAFADFAGAKNTAGTAWMFAPIGTREWGTSNVALIPANAYDAVLYIDTVTAPEPK